jgi:hypothetical protein
VSEYGFIHVTEDTDCWWAVVDMAMNLWVSKIYWLAEALSPFEEKYFAPWN